jgi:hypothetical protein
MQHVTDVPTHPRPQAPAEHTAHHPGGGVSAIRAARQWPVFQQNKRTNFWINTLLTIVALAASYGAALGQAGFAELYLGMHGPERYVVFLIIEATAVALMLLANQTALAGDSAGGLWALVWAVTAGAVTMQIVHANAIGQPQAAMVYATASVLTVVLWRAKTRRGLRDRLRAAGMIEDPLPRYRPIRWILRPRETFRAWYLALGEGVSDPATAMDMARADRLFHRSATAARTAVRRARKADQPLPDLTGQRHVVPPWRVTHPDAHRFGVLPWHQHVPVQPTFTQATAQASAGTDAHTPAAPVAATPVPAPPVAATPVPAPPVVRHQPPAQRIAEPMARDEPILPAPLPTFSAPADFEPPVSVPPQPERPVSAVPELMTGIREQLNGVLPTATELPVRANGSIRAAVFDALDVITDTDEGMHQGEIVGALADRFPGVELGQLVRYFEQYGIEVTEGRRRHRIAVS